MHKVTSGLLAALDSERLSLSKAGEGIGDLDLQIASIALEQNAVLVSHNYRHFSRLAELGGLVLEDWLEVD
jgi:tRNA(fMet)-specific endonuclease VapC